jgi:antagonist of KipI
VIRVELPGLMSTVQDLGREGFGPLGVSASGAADPIALRIGNRLLGNTEGAAALELTLVGGTFRFETDTWVSLTGSDFDATLDGEPLTTWTAHPVGAGQVLQMRSTRTGARSYLCVSGGIEVPLVLGSASTHVLSALGGLNGRPLRKGDALRTGPCRPPAARRLNPDMAERLAPRRRLRVTDGLQSDWFIKASQRALFEVSFRVTEASDRMGLRLEGSPIESTSQADLITTGVALGAIQVPPGGQPVIVFVEQQTTGGYPVIANVIAADLASVGQLRPRDAVEFELVSQRTARELILEQESWLGSDHLLLQ